MHKSTALAGISPPVMIAKLMWVAMRVTDESFQYLLEAARGGSGCSEGCGLKTQGDLSLPCFTSQA